MTVTKQDSTERQHYGVIGIFGKPNAGKSTLMNALVGQKLAAVSRKAHTTREQISGIVIHHETQMLLVDTPGAIQMRQLSKLQKAMKQQIKESFKNVDLALYLVDVQNVKGSIAWNVLAPLLDNIENVPLKIVFTKLDTIKNFELKNLKKDFNDLMVAEGRDYPKKIWQVSSRDRVLLRGLKDNMAKLMPEEEWQHPVDDLSTKSFRFMIAELIREQLFRQLGQELPFHCEVSVDRVEEKTNLFVVEACIMVQENRYKGMVVGKGGEKIKRIGTEARKSLELNYNSKFHLDLFVKVGDII